MVTSMRRHLQIQVSIRAGPGTSRRSPASGDRRAERSFNPRRPRNEPAMFDAAAFGGVVLVSIRAGPGTSRRFRRKAQGCHLFGCFNPRRPRNEPAIAQIGRRCGIGCGFNPRRPRNEPAMVAVGRNFDKTGVSIRAGPGTSRRSLTCPNLRPIDLFQSAPAQERAGDHDPRRDVGDVLVSIRAGPGTSRRSGVYRPNTRSG